MRFNARKILAVLSSAVLSFNILCTSIYSAEETKPIITNSVQTGTDLTVQGTDAFGNMLAAELQSAQDEQIENEGQNIFSIEMTGNTATVENDVIEDCSVVVGIYDESGTTMLASGNADVSADNNIVQLTIDIDTMPQYYYIKAFLINKQTMRPLCSVYENPMYTQEMQEFLAKTTDDFEADKVYNLDDDKTNNFAVFKDNVTVLDTEPIYSGSGGISNSGGSSSGGSGETDDPNVDIYVEKNRLSLGGYHSAYITTNGDLYMWGYNYLGQLGDGTINSKPPVKIMSNVAHISLGRNHSACITTNGDLYMWGYNSNGQLGDGTRINITTPVKIMSNVAQVSLGSSHSACITTNGDLYMWGTNSSGKLGDGTRIDRYTPVKIMSNVARVSLGMNHSACITTNGDLYMWGYNYYGQLGDGTRTDSYTPVKIMSNVARVSLGNIHSACITTNGDLYTWGSNNFIQLGDGTRTDRYTPVKIMSNVARVSLGERHSACITTNSDLYTWGWNKHGQLGDGTKTDRSTPTKITIPTETIADYIAIVNSIPDGDNVILTYEQLVAIEKVLEYDYKNKN